MNLEMIQSRLRDINEMRNTSDANEMALINRNGQKGRNGTDYEEDSGSSLSFRFLLALGIFAFLALADLKEISGTESLLDRAEKAISYNIKPEDVVKLQEVCYNIERYITLQP